MLVIHSLSANPRKPKFQPRRLSSDTRYQMGYRDGVVARQKNKHPAWAKDYRVAHPTDTVYGKGFWNGWDDAQAAGIAQRIGANPKRRRRRRKAKRATKTVIKKHPRNAYTGSTWIIRGVRQRRTKKSNRAQAVYFTGRGWGSKAKAERFTSLSHANTLAETLMRRAGANMVIIEVIRA